MTAEDVSNEWGREMESVTAVRDMAVLCEEGGKDATTFPLESWRHGRPGCVRRGFAPFGRGHCRRLGHGGQLLVRRASGADDECKRLRNEHRRRAGSRGLQPEQPVPRLRARP